jgi:hypothetical protein
MIYFFEKLLLEFDFDPDSILIDFEQATIKSITRLFPDAIQKGTHDAHIDILQCLVSVVFRLPISYGTMRLAARSVNRSSE